MVKEARDRDRALAQANGNGTAEEMEVDPPEDENAPATAAAHGSNIIVVHVGSSNLRIGLANDVLPKTVPMVIARKWKETEADEGDGEPLPKRRRVEGDESPLDPDQLFGDEVCELKVKHVHVLMFWGSLRHNMPLCRKS
jgi:actin-related protein 8